jgi:hypothetical protein
MPPPDMLGIVGVGPPTLDEPLTYDIVGRMKNKEKILLKESSPTLKSKGLLGYIKGGLKLTV